MQFAGLQLSTPSCWRLSRASCSGGCGTASCSRKQWLEGYRQVSATEVKGDTPSPTPFIISFRRARWSWPGSLAGVLRHLGPGPSNLAQRRDHWRLHVARLRHHHAGGQQHFPGRQSRSLTLIDGGHWLGVLLLQGAVIGWLGRLPLWPDPPKCEIAVAARAFIMAANNRKIVGGNRPMSEKLHPVHGREWAARAWIDEKAYRSAVQALDQTTPTGSGARSGKRIDWIKPYTRSRTPRSGPTTSRSSGSRTARSTSAPTASTGISKTRGDQVAIIWEGDDPDAGREDHLSAAARARLQVRQRAEGARRQEGRPRHDLPADDPRGGLRDARLRAHRRGAFGRVRRLLAGQPRRPHRGCAIPSSSSRPTRACAAASRSRSRRTPTRRCKKCKGDEKVLVVRRTGGPIAVGRRPRHLAARGAGEGRRRLPAGGDERGGSAVHPLHLGLDRQAQGRAAHHRRLSRLRRR